MTTDEGIILIPKPKRRIIAIRQARLDIAAGREKVQAARQNLSLMLNADIHIEVASYAYLFDALSALDQVEQTLNRFKV